MAAAISEALNVCKSKGLVTRLDTELPEENLDGTLIVAQLMLLKKKALDPKILHLLKQEIVNSSFSEEEATEWDAYAIILHEQYQQLRQADLILVEQREFKNLWMQLTAFLFDS